jgi:hypothetical protein
MYNTYDNIDMAKRTDRQARTVPLLFEGYEILEISGK